RRIAALQLVFGDLPDEMRAAQLAHLQALEAAGQSSWEGVFEGRRGDRLVGAIWITPQPGRAAGLWPPRVVVGEPTTTLQGMLDEAVRWGHQQGMQLVQALLPTDASADHELFAASGFRHLCDLLYAVCLNDSFPTRQPESPLEFETWSSANEQR